ncbi:phage head-tail connector protein [Anaeromassilibacillus senegalensis]|uniref:phage head-tail connector protein n=1 Tax=Anaeromassilibacillus senegalensis TaxID=1673717 RepID=UPI0006821A34|nr:phage head-tail connector protein [Anaeromassilibacillus senegalensis]
MLDQILSALDGLTDLERAEVLCVLMAQNDRLSKVKALLGITGTDQDDLLLFVVQTTEEMVLAYINQDTLPAPLEKVLVVMCVSYYKAAGLGTTQAAVGPVSSIKRGDVQTSFANASGASGSASTFNLGADGQDFFGWRTVLNNFRKLRW